MTTTRVLTVDAELLDHVEALARADTSKLLICCVVDETRGA